MRSGTCIPIQKPLPSPNASSFCGQVAEEQAAAAAAAALGGQVPAGSDASAAAAEHDGAKSSGDGGADGGGEEGETSGLAVADTGVEGITSALAAAKVGDEEDEEEGVVDVRAEAEADVLGSQSALAAAKVADEEEEGVGQEVEDGGAGDADAGVPGITAALAATALGEHEPTNPSSPAWQPAPPGATAADRRGDRGGAGGSALGLSWSGAEPDPDAQDAAEVAGGPGGPPRVLHGTRAAVVVAAELSDSAGEVAGGEVTSGGAGEPAQDPNLDLNRSRSSCADAAADSVAAAAEQLGQVALGAGAPTLDMAAAVKPEPADQACGLPAGPPPAARSAGRCDRQYGRPDQSKENRRVSANAGGGGGGAADGGRRGATPVGKPKATPKAGAGVSSGVAAMRGFWEQASAAKPAGGPAGVTSRKGN